MRLPGPRSGERVNLSLYLSGRTVSVLMSSVYTFAIGLYVLKLTGSGLSFAITLSLQIAPTILLGPFSGVLADQFDKKTMTVSADAFNGILFIFLFLASFKGLSLAEIYTATLLLSVSLTLYNICIDSAIPGIVSKGRIPLLNSAAKMIDSAAAIAAPGLGGLLYAAVDIRLFILFNGVSFILSAAAECLIDFRLYDVVKPQIQKFGLKKNLREGFEYIGRTSWLKSVLMNFVLINFFLSLCYAIPVPYILNTVFQLPANIYGAVQCFVPVGMIAGALLAKAAAERIPYGTMITVTGASCSACLFLFGLFPAVSAYRPVCLIVPYYAFLLACFGAVVSLTDIPFANSLQLRVPDHIRGRALSISVSVVKVFAPIGYLLSGGLLKVIPAYYIPLCGGILLPAFYLLARRRTTPA